MKTYRQLVAETNETNNVVDFRKAHDEKKRKDHEARIAGQDFAPKMSFEDSVKQHAENFHKILLDNLPDIGLDEFTKASLNRDHPGKHPLIAIAHELHHGSKMSQYVKNNADKFHGLAKSALNTAYQKIKIGPNWKNVFGGNGAGLAAYDKEVHNPLRALERFTLGHKKS